MTASRYFLRGLRIALLLLGAAFILAPFLFMVSTSLKPQAEVFSSTLQLVPQQWFALANYTKALTRIPMGQVLLNGFYVCLAIVVFQILFALPCAYALAKLRFRGREWVFGLVTINNAPRPTAGSQGIAQRHKPVAQSSKPY